MPYMSTIGDYRMWFEAVGKSSNDPVVLLHGFTGTHSTWADLSKRLMKEHFVIKPDLPGHGRSGASPTPEGMNLDAISDELLRLLDLLKVSKTALLGYSLGGRVALNFALRHQDRLTSLILESSSPGIQDSAEREKRKVEDDALAMDIERYGLNWFVHRWEEMPLFASQKSLGSSVIQSVRNDRLSNTGHGLSMSLRSAGIGTMMPVWDQLHRIRIPVLLIVGEKDEKFSAIAEAMSERVAHCTLKVVEGGGHSTHLERPETFHKIVEEFMDARSRGDR
jgi:2-succinyl-6-hydroxy-2,4-cyclohexadiene-1-carboxylate synthase